MNCRECEVELGSELITTEIEEHLKGCAECRGLWDEIRANSEAFREMAQEDLPSVSVRIPSQTRWAWVAMVAAAAVIVAAITFGTLHQERVRPPVLIASAPSIPEAPALPQPVAIRPAVRRTVRKQMEETLRVKMFTSDPDVVIYWLVDKKEGIE